MVRAIFERFELRIKRSDAESGSHQGRCDADIAMLRREPYIQKQLDDLDPNKVRNELRDYGAWDDEQLADDDSNLDRILWIACGNIVEGN